MRVGAAQLIAVRHVVGWPAILGAAGKERADGSVIPQHAENNQTGDHDHDPYSTYDEYGKYDVLVIGGTGVDTIVRVDSLPVPLADSVHVGPIEEWPGHTGGNVALGTRALGLKVGLLDCIDDDWIGAQVRERMSKGGVEFLPLISPAGTRRAVNLVDASGRRMSFYDGRDPADLRMPRDFYLPRLRRTRHVHLSILTSSPA